MKYTKIYNEQIDETVYAGQHSTGLGVFVVPKPGFSKKYAVIGTKFGSVNNCFIPLGESEPITVPDGVAHFLEHKMFEQSDGTNAFDKFSVYGANANAYTSFTCTCYLFSCTKNFEDNFVHLLKYVQDPYYTDENVQKEQGIIGQEIKMYDDEGSWQVALNLLKALYHNNPVKIDIAGTVESISHITKDTLYKCYNTYYNPSNMVVTVCGDVEPREVFELVEKYVRTDRECGEVTSVYPDEPASVCQKYIEAKSKVALPLFSLGFKDNFPKSGDALLKRETAIHLICKLLAGRSSDLYTGMYEDGLINEEFGTDIMTEPLFSCVSFCGESNDPKEVQHRIMSEIERLRRDKFDEADFDRIKRAYLGEFMRAFNDVEATASMVERNILNEVNIFNLPSVLDSIDPAYVYDVFNQIFTEETSALSVVFPNDK